MNDETKQAPAPGSDEAVKLGCICPVYDNCRGHGYMGMNGIYVYNEGCKVHASKEVKEQKDNEHNQD